MLPGMKTVNSERDLSLPLDKHRILENYYDSQEDGMLYLIVCCLTFMFCLLFFCVCPFLFVFFFLGIVEDLPPAIISSFNFPNEKRM